MIKFAPITSQLVQNKIVLVRVDYNVPLEKNKNGTITVKDDSRLIASFKTINFLKRNGAKIILMSHLGRPKKEKTNNTGKSISDEDLSLRIVAEVLGSKYHLPIKFIDDCIGLSVKKAVVDLNPGEILLLENLRFYKDEKANSPHFARALAQLADIYINDAFSNSHREHSSMKAIGQFITGYAGLHLREEVENLDRLITNPHRPFVLVVGGAKIADKVETLQYLSNIADVVLVGGGIANNFLQAENIEIHKSYIQELVEKSKKANKEPIDSPKNYVEVADQIIEAHRHQKFIQKGYLPLPKILYPLDVIAVAPPPVNSKNIFNFAHSSPTVKTIDLTNYQDTNKNLNLMYADIGPKTTKLFQEIIRQAKTIFWNGPMGIFEEKKFSTGTRVVAENIAKSSAFSVIGGGDTINAANTFKLTNRYSYVSTAGGASLFYLSGQKLPGLIWLKT